MKAIDKAIKACDEDLKRKSWHFHYYFGKGIKYDSVKAANKTEAATMAKLKSPPNVKIFFDTQE